MYSELTNVDDYRNLVNQHQETIGKKDSQFDTNKHSSRQDTTKFVVIERIKPMTRLNTPSKFRCYLVGKQGSINQKSNKKPYLTCDFSKGKGKLWLSGGDTVLGTLSKHKKHLEFHVNDRVVLSMTVLYAPDYHLYTMKYEGQEYNMVNPVDRRGQQNLRYKLIKTSKLGIESVNNFAMNDNDDNRVLECLKVTNDQLLVAYREPFNHIVAIVAGILRYRGKTININ